MSLSSIEQMSQRFCDKDGEPSATNLQHDGGKTNDDIFKGTYNIQPLIACSNITFLGGHNCRIKKCGKKKSTVNKKSELQ